MNNNSIRGRMMASTMLAGLMLMAAAPSVAQTNAEGASEVGEIVVTGSRIKRAETTTAAPVAVIDAQTFSDRGFVQAGQALNQITSNLPSIPIAAGSGSAAGTGQQYPNLFGLGPGRTLTLVNGRRMVTSSSGQFSQNAPGQGDRVVDTNIIPAGLLERVDVVQAGGAAVYGSDAIAGVVNYVLKSNFTGVELDAQYGESTRGDYPVTSLRGTFGKNFLNDRGNVALDLEYSKTEPLSDYDRPRSNLGRVAVANTANTSNTDGIPSVRENLNTRFTSFNYNGLLFSPAAAPLTNFIVAIGGVPQQFNTAGTALVPYSIGVPGGIPFSSGGDGLPYQELASLYVGVERFNANFLGHYDITDRIKLSAEVSWSHVQTRDPYRNLQSNTVLNNAASGAGAIPIARSNPYLDPLRSQVAAGGPPLFLSKAFSDLLYTREGQFETDTARAVLALDGDFDLGERNFYWSLSASHAETDGSQRGYAVWQTRFNNALQAVRNASGQIVCGINADANPNNNDAACVPINPFGQGNITQEARNYVNVLVGQDYLNTQDDYLATFGGDVVDLPAGKVKFSVAYEHRREKAKFVPLDANQRGLVESQVAQSATGGQFHTDELSGELLVPVVGGDFTLPFVQALELDGSYRYVDNSLAGKEDVWGVGGRWEIVSGVTARISRSRNFRAPTLDQQFAPTRTALDSVGQDPCDFRYIANGPAPATRLANCQALFRANPGYGPLATFQNSSSNFSTAQVTSGGNPNLKNEISNTLTFGFVLQPRFVPGLTIVADRIEVDLKDGLSAFIPQNFSETCFDATTPSADVCSTFTRDAVGNVIAATRTTFNAGRVTYRGETYNINYAFPVGRFFDGADYGEVELNLSATHTAKLVTSVTGTDRSRTDNTVAQPDWVANFDARYHYGPFRLSYQLIYLDKVFQAQNASIESTPTPVIKENIRHNLSAQYTWQNYTLRTGVVNLTNEEPSFPTRNYGDILGRQWFVGLKARF
ncbi:MAG: TonB-dependent receptor [Alphaproteobacteria bacterium]|nr:TonB-dependent receptor [Alphaproteobacteria bacterium]MBU1515300.1 TonB-dependent receptor [Alphaproteobacteria bacterium]MBU2092430.1 TonB-dependent receptor [Alphaproteobacteria bacterium]MBU2153024.1 TonB-dependent receptor [Alphaproteobacteria bacterium]MBU2305855.1 TonB-dependent receptor [Alphaproteobacteria bacterium]